MAPIQSKKSEAHESEASAAQSQPPEPEDTFEEPLTPPAASSTPIPGHKLNEGGKTEADKRACPLTKGVRKNPKRKARPPIGSLREPSIEEQTDQLSRFFESVKPNRRRSSK